MQYKTFKKVKILTTSFIAAMVAMAVVNDNIYLAWAGVLIGLLFLTLVKRKTKAVLVDERIKSISGYAARMAYVILTMTLAFLSLVFVSSGQRTGQPEFEMLGIILSYITLLSLALYSVAYKYYSKKYGEEKDDQ